MKTLTVLLLFMLLGVRGLYAYDSVPVKKLPDSVAVCLSYTPETIEVCKNRVKQYFRRLSVAQLIAPENKELIVRYCSGVKDEKLNTLMSNEKLVYEQLGEGYYHAYIRQAFEIDFQKAVSNQDEAILKTIDEYLLKRYLEADDYLEGFTGLYQRYYIETLQWKKYNFEVMRYYADQRSQEYLYAEVEECLENLKDEQEVMRYVLGWLDYLGKKEKSFRNEVLKGKVCYYLEEEKDMKKHFKSAKKLAKNTVEMNYLNQVEQETLKQ